MARLLPTLLALALSASAALAEEIPISYTDQRGNPPATRRIPDIAAGDDGFLAAWLDERAFSSTVMVARLTDAGEPLDPMGIALGASAWGRPQVIWNGEAWLVFWSESFYSASPNTGLMMARVNRDGTTTRPVRILDDAPPSTRERSVASNGESIVILHGGSTYGYPVSMRVAVLTLGGTVLDDRVVDSGDSHGFAPTVFVNGRQFVAAWNVERNGGVDLKALRLDARGVPVDNTPRVLGSARNHIELALHGNRYVAFGPVSDAYPNPPYSSWAVSSDLDTVTQPAPLLLEPYDRPPEILDSADGLSVLTFEPTVNNGAVAAVRFDEQGHENGRHRLMELPSIYEFAAARRNGNLALIWIEYSSGEVWTLKGSTFDASTFAQKTAARTLTESAPSLGGPQIAAGPAELLAVWGVNAFRFSPQGARLDANPIRLADNGFQPSVVFDGQRYVVAFLTSTQTGGGREIVVRFISPTAGLLDDQIHIPVDYSVWSMSLTRGDSVTLLLWSQSPEIYAAGITGTQLAAPPRTMARSGSQPANLPAAAWNGHHFLVTWNEGLLDYDMYLWDKIFGIRVGPDLQPADGQPRLLVDGSRTFGRYQALTALGDEWWMVWEEPAGAANLYIARIGADGISKDGPTGKSLAAGFGFYTRLITIGGRVHVAWNTTDGVLHAAALRDDGTLDPAGQRRIEPPTPFGSVALTSLTSYAGQIILAYHRVTPEAGYVNRAYLDIPPVKRRRSVR